MSVYIFSAKLRNSLLLFIFFLSIAHTASHLLVSQIENRYTLELIEMFSFEREGNLPAYFSSLLLMVASALFLVVGKGAQAQENSYWRYWFGLGIIFAFLSFDEAIQIHEKFDNNSLLSFVETEGLLAWPWVILYGALVLIFVGAFSRFWWRLPLAHRSRIAICGATFVVAAIGFEMLGALEYTSNGKTAYFWVLITIEETMEMLAIVFLIYSLMRYIYEEMPELKMIFQS